MAFRMVVCPDLDRRSGLLGCWFVAHTAKEKDPCGKSGKILAVTVVVFLASVFVSMWLLNHFTNKRLKSFAHGLIHSLNFTFEERNTEIKHPTVIGEFWSIISSARKVIGHHIHPVDNITLFLSEIGYTYSLDKDSKVIDEF